MHLKFIQKGACVSCLWGLLFFSSCKTQKDSLVEPQKDFSGTWRISKVERNSTDITAWADTSSFRLMLASDGSYTLQNNHIPFLVNQVGGTWASDDPLYPFFLSFKGTDSTNAKTGSITTPISGGERSIEMTFSPGCPSNTYVYTFIKTNQ